MTTIIDLLNETQNFTIALLGWMYEICTSVLFNSWPLNIAATLCLITLVLKIIRRLKY